MRCLNCGTLVSDADPCCLSCGARCTTPVGQQQVGRPVPYLGLTLMFVGMFAYPLLNRPDHPVHDRATITHHKTIAYAWGLAGLFIGFLGDAVRWSCGRNKKPTPRTQDWPAIVVGPGPANRLQSAQAVRQPEPPPWERSRLVRIIFGVVWAVVFFFIGAVASAVWATRAAGDDAALQEQLATQAGETVGPWVLLGSILLPIVGGTLGLLPGVCRKKR